MGVLPICISLSTCISPIGMSAALGCQKRTSEPWNCSHGWLRGTMWMLEIELASSARAVSALSSWAMPPAPVLSLKGVAHITLYSHKTALSYYMPISILSYTASSQLLSDIALPIIFPPVSSSASSSDSNLNYHQATFICFFIHPNDHQSLFLWSQNSVAHQNSVHLSPCW